MSDTTSTTLNFKSHIRQSVRDEHITQLRGAFAAVATMPEYTLGRVLSDLDGDNMRETLLSLTVVELRSIISPAAEKPAKEKKVSTDVKIENWTDAAVKAAHAERVMAFLSAKGLGEGDHARGFTPVELRKESSIQGNEDQLRETMQTLEAAGKVAFTGDTKGKRYVVASLKAKAEAAFRDYKAAKAKADAEKEARKASGESTKGRKTKTA